MNIYIPFLNDIISFVDCSKYTFCQSLYILTKLNSISFEKLRDLKLSNKEIKKIKEYERINLEFLDNTPLEFILYKYDKNDIFFITVIEIFNYKINIILIIFI